MPRLPYSRLMSPAAHWTPLDCLSGISNLTYAKLESCQPLTILLYHSTPPPPKKSCFFFQFFFMSVNCGSILLVGLAKNLGFILDFFPFFHTPYPTANPINVTFKTQWESDPSLTTSIISTQSQALFSLNYYISLLTGFHPSTLAHYLPTRILSTTIWMIFKRHVR